MQTHLVKRGNVYYVRRKVPVDLKAHYLKPDIRESLKTSDKITAIERARARVAELDAEFIQKRASLAAASTTTRPLTVDLAAAIAGALVAHILSADEEQRLEGMDEASFDARSAQHQADLAALRKGYSRGDSRSIDAQLDDWLTHYSLTADHESLAFKTLRRDFLTAALEAQQGKVQRDAGQLVRTPNKPVEEVLSGPVVAPAGRGKAVSMQALLDAWVIERKPAHKTVQMATAGIKEFEGIVKQKDVGKLTAQDGVIYKDALIAKHPTRTTAVRKFMTTSAILRLAKRNHRITANVLEGLSIEAREDEETRIEFPKEALQALFASPVFTAGSRPQAGAGEAAYWLPLIGLYEGMRQAEIGQLFAHDIKVKDGVHYFDINRENGKTVKNRGSVRTVPVHPELIRLGLLDYVKTQKGGRLFPQLTEDSHGSLTGNWSKWFGRYLRKTAKVYDKRIVFHSFRHNFKTASRDAGVPLEVHDALTGHIEGTSGSRYGEVSMKLKGQELAKVQFALPL